MGSIARKNLFGPSALVLLGALAATDAPAAVLNVTVVQALDQTQPVDLTSPEGTPAADARTAFFDGLDVAYEEDFENSPNTRPDNGFLGTLDIAFTNIKGGQPDITTGASISFEEAINAGVMFPGSGEVLSGESFGAYDTTQPDHSGNFWNILSPSDSQDVVFMTLNLGVSVDSIGWFGTDWSDQGGSVSAALYNQGSLITDGMVDITAEFPDLVSTQTSLAWVQIFSDTGVFDRVDFIVNNAGPSADRLGFDDIMIGEAAPPPPDDGGNGDVAEVPEPGTIALLGAGLLGLGAVRRRSRKA